MTRSQRKQLEALKRGNQKRAKRLQAGARRIGRFNFAGTVRLEAAASTGQRQLSILAYNGGLMTVEGFGAIVIDLAGLRIPENLPILASHANELGSVIGTGTAKVVAGSLVVTVATVKTAAAAEALGLLEAGVALGASVGAQPTQARRIDPGQEITVNGRKLVAGPGGFLLVEKAELKEVSVLPIAADAETTVSIAASGTLKGQAMDFDQWLLTMGFEDQGSLTPVQLANLQKVFEQEVAEGDLPASETAADTPAAGGNPAPAGNPVPAAAAAAAVQPIQGRAPAVPVPPAVDPSVLAMRSEYQRQADIGRICAAAGDPTMAVNKQQVSIAAHAVANNWDLQRTELEIRRVERPQGPHFHVPTSPELSDAVLEAAVLHAGRSRLLDDGFFDATGERDAIPAGMRGPIQREIRARYSDQVQQAAHTLFRGRIGLQQILVAGAVAGGYRGSEVIRDDGSLASVLRAAFPPGGMIRAGDGFSSISIANILANVQNKFLLQGYLFSEMTWRQCCGVRSVKDFKATRAVNLLSDTTFNQIASDGEIKHAALTDQAFANQAYSYGRMLTIPRQTIINDDLSALTAAPMALGRGAGLKMNSLFWSTFMNPGYDDGGSTNFFAATHTLTGGQTGNANYATGAGTALSSTSLTAAVLLFDNQIDPVGLPLGIDASILLYPPDLETTARELMTSQLALYGGSTKTPNTNIWQGRFNPYKSRYLNKAAFTGYSTTAWFLLADPAMLPVIEAVFLNGQETPTVQTAEADFSTLGISMRAYFDAGVAMQNFRGGVKMAGA